MLIIGRNTSVLQVDEVVLVEDEATIRAMRFVWESRSSRGRQTTRGFDIDILMVPAQE